jgi:tyrosyl-tRNA synthetase
MKDFSFINFARDVGKRITVNYMMAKKIRLKKTTSGDAGEGGRVLRYAPINQG